MPTLGRRIPVLRVYVRFIECERARIRQLFQLLFNLMCGCGEGQSDINDRMRAILVDWLVEVHLKFKVRPFTP